MSERLRCQFMFTSKRRCANTAVTNGLCLYHGSIDALCARHDITVEGIVALVDEVMKSRPTPSPANLPEAIEDCWGNSDDLYYAGWEVGYHDAATAARRLARGEEA